MLQHENELQLPYSSEADEFEASPIAQIKRAVEKRLRAGILVFVLTAPLALGWAVLSNKPYYQSAATVQVNPMRPRILYRTFENELNQSYDTFFETQMAFVNNDAVLSKCLENPAVRNHPLLKNAINPVKVLKRALLVKRDGTTQLFSISLQFSDPKDLDVLVNAVLDSYMARINEANANAQENKFKLLKKESEKLRLQAEEKRRTLSKVREEVASDPNASSSMIFSRDPVSMTQEAIVEAKAQEYSLRAKLATLKESLKANEIQVSHAEIEQALQTDPEVERLSALGLQLRQLLVSAQATAGSPASALARESIEQDPEIVAIKQDLAAKELELASMTRRLKPNHPWLISAKQDLAACRQRLAAKMKEMEKEITMVNVKQEAERRVKELQRQVLQIEDQIHRRRETQREVVAERLKEDHKNALKSEVNELTWEIKAAEIRVKELTQNLQKQLQQRTKYEQKSAELKSLQDDLERTRQAHSQIEERLHELEIESAAPGYVSVAVRAEPPKSPEPYFMSRVKYGMVGLVGAACLAVLAMVLLEQRDDRIWAPQDLPRSLSTELLGSVPSGWYKGGIHAGLICRADPDSYFAEQLRNVMSSVLHPADGKDARTILVTSALPGDGKTTLATNLATCIADLGKNVLLVDANFRKPDIADIFEFGVTAGLGDILLHNSDVTQLARAVEPNFSVLPAGTPLPQSGLVGSVRMRDLLKRLKDEHDYVIIDAPPLLLTDSRILAPMVDGVVCSFRAFTSKRADVQESLATLRRLGARTLGVTLLNVDPKYTACGAIISALETYSLPDLRHLAKNGPDTAGTEGIITSITDKKGTAEPDGRDADQPNDDVSGWPKGEQ